jgi:tetrahydromethanopterin S-methyltransferase subunit G
MEAAVAEKGAAMTEWNDGRFDDLSKRVDRIEKKVDDGFARVDKQMNESFVRVDSRLDDINRVLIQSVWTFGIGMLCFAGALLGVIAVKL